MDIPKLDTRNPNQRSGFPPTYDTASDPLLYDGVVSRRALAFGIDFIIVIFLTIAVYVLTFFLGFLTFGLAWLALGLIYPGVALIYAGLGLSAPRAATIGMRSMGIHLRMLNGRRIDFLFGVFHSLGFYVSVVVLTPFSLAIALFEPRGRLVHDLLLGTEMVDSNAARQNS